MPNFGEELMGQRQLYHVPESPDYTNLDQRLQKLEGRTISDIDLDEMTKPAPKEFAGAPEEVQKSMYHVPESSDVTQGISAMQELDMSMIPPEVLVALGDGIKKATMQDPTMDQATKEQIMSLSDNNLGEFVGKVLEKAAEIPDEEVSSMSMEKEEEAEGIIDRLMGNETEEMGWRERLNQLGSPEDINFAPTGLNLGGPVPGTGGRGFRAPISGGRGFRAPPQRQMPPMPGGRGWNQGGAVAVNPFDDPNFDWDKWYARDPIGREPGDPGRGYVAPQQTPRQAEMQSYLTGAAPRGGGRGWNQGGQVQQYNLGGIASMGRGGDSQLAHVMPGERMVPPGVVDDGMLDAAFVRAGLDPMEYKVGSSQASINPMTGMPEYGLFSFVKRLLKKVKKIAPVIGQIVGFAYGGPIGAGIGKAIGGVLKTGDLDFKDALMNFGTGWAMGNFATGMGMKGGRGFKSIFKGAGKGGMWGWGTTPTIQHTIEQGDTVASIAKEYGITEQELLSANPGAMPVVGNTLNVPKLDTSVGGFIQQAGAKVAAGLGGGPMPTDLATGKPYEFGLMEQFKGLSAGQKLGVGALGLAALSKTGMFDEEELGDVPPEIQSEMEGLQAYANQPLTAAVQGQWGVGAPTVSTPTIPSHTSFYTPPSQSSSLTAALAELNKTNLRLPSPVFT
jgi:LysM repeat protein